MAIMDAYKLDLRFATRSVIPRRRRTPSHHQNRKPAKRLNSKSKMWSSSDALLLQLLPL